MSIKVALRQYLLTQVNVISLVGDRVHHNYRPQRGELPAVSFFGVSRTHRYNLEGTGRDNVPVDRIQIDCYARSADQAEEVADAVRAALDGFRGHMSDVFVQACLLEEAGRDDYYPDQAGSDRGIHAVSLDAVISYESTAPTFP